MNIHVQFGFKNASSLKPLGQLKPNCPGMIIGRSSTKFLFFYADRKSIQLAQWFRRRSLKCEKFTDDRRWTPSDGNSSPGPLVLILQQSHSAGRASYTVI
jgi:hypothetical protein